MLSYKDFELALKKIKAFEKQQEKLQKFASFISGHDDRTINEFGDEFRNDYIDLLAKSMDGDSDKVVWFIIWFVIENDWGTKGLSFVFNDNKNHNKYAISNGKQLYDFIIKNK